MNTVLTIVAFLIGLAVVVYACFKLGSLMPFSVDQMRARRQSIEEALASAQKSEQRLNEVRAEIDAEIQRAREQADEIVSRARREAVAVTDETQRKARADAAAFLERARSDVEVERERAITELRRELSDLVVQGAGAVLAEAIDEKAHARLIEQSLESIPAGEAQAH